MVERFVEPKVFITGFTGVDREGLTAYLKHTGQEQFLDAVEQAERDGIAPAEWLVSFYAKLCYKSLVVGQNANLQAVRDIKGNVEGILKTAHGSVLEHVSVNFIVTDCSRVATHEQVRHRVGVAYSQTSGRYCRIDIGGLQVVWDPILEGCEDLAVRCLNNIERTIYYMECRKGLRVPPAVYPNVPMDAWHWPLVEVVQAGYLPSFAAESDKSLLMWVPNTAVDFTTKKKLTSAFRRFAPNGQSNEIGMTLNIRTLRHTIMMRTARYAEWEIRKIYEQIYLLMKERFPLLFSDAQEEIIEGVIEVSRMRMNPYDRALSDHSDAEIVAEMQRRGLMGFDPAEPGQDRTVNNVHRLGSGAEELPASAK